MPHFQSTCVALCVLAAGAIQVKEVPAGGKCTEYEINSVFQVPGPAKRFMELSIAVLKNNMVKGVYEHRAEHRRQQKAEEKALEAAKKLAAGAELSSDEFFPGPLANVHPQAMFEKFFGDFERDIVEMNFTKEQHKACALRDEFGFFSFKWDLVTHCIEMVTGIREGCADCVENMMEEWAGHNYADLPYSCFTDCFEILEMKHPHWEKASTIVIDKYCMKCMTPRVEEAGLCMAGKNWQDVIMRLGLEDGLTRN